MWFTKEEIKTHMKVGSIDAITGGDDTIITAAIDGASAEAKGYLTDFDTTAIFATTGTSRHPLLLTFIKDLAVWHLVVLSNYTADVKFREARYTRAVEWLKGVQKKDIVPDFPAKVDTEGATVTEIKYSSNPKRIQHF